MKNRCTYKLICSLLCSIALFTSCNGQEKRAVVNNESVNGKPKLVKTMGTGEYNAVNCGMQDRSGNLWFGTTGEGAYCYNGKTFTNFTEKDGLANTIYSIIQDKNGAIWFSTDKGLCHYAPPAANTIVPGIAQENKNAFTRISIAEINGSYFYPDNSKSNNPALNFQFRGLMQDKNGKIWIGTSTDGVYCYDGKSFTHFLHNDGVVNKDSLRLNQVTCILQDKNGNIWFTTWFEGICKYDGKSITSYKPKGKVWFASILEDKNGSLWFGTRFSGAYRFDPSSATKAGAEAFTDFSDIPIFSSCCVFAMAEDKAGNIWFATEFDDLATRDSFGGVWRYDPAIKGRKAFTNFTMRDGLSSNDVFSVTEDSPGNLWFGTRNIGLNRYDGKAIIKFSE